MPFVIAYRVYRSLCLLVTLLFSYLFVNHLRLFSPTDTLFLDSAAAQLPPAGSNASGSAPKTVGGCCVPLGLPQPLLLEEKKFLLAVERGDIPNVRR